MLINPLLLACLSVEPITADLAEMARIPPYAVCHQQSQLAHGFLEWTEAVEEGRQEGVLKQPAVAVVEARRRFGFWWALEHCRDEAIEFPARRCWYRYARQLYSEREWLTGDWPTPVPTQFLPQWRGE